MGSTADGFSPPADMEILPTETPATAGNAEPSLVQSTESSFVSLGRARVRACSPARAEEMVDWDLARGLACRTREQVVVPRSKSKGEQEGLLDKINLAGIILRTEFSSRLAKGGILERLAHQHQHDACFRRDAREAHRRGGEASSFQQFDGEVKSRRGNRKRYEIGGLHAVPLYPGV